MTPDAIWYGYTRVEYYELIWQPGDPEWEDLEQESED